MDKEYQTIKVAGGYQVQVKYLGFWHTVNNEDGTKLIFETEMDALIFALTYNVEVEPNWMLILVGVVLFVAVFTLGIYVYHNYIK